MIRKAVFTILLTTAAAIGQRGLAAQQLPLHWSGVATVHGQQIPVHLDLSPGRWRTNIGSFVNSTEPTSSRPDHTANFSRRSALRLWCASPAGGTKSTLTLSLWGLQSPFVMNFRRCNRESL